MSDKTILVTRPAGDEKQLTDMLHARGLRVIHEPLTHIYLHHTRRHELQAALLAEPDAVLVTSKHAVNALAFLSELRDVYLICVGEATARAAYSQGFDRVEIAGPAAGRMIDHVLSCYDPGARFLYISGEHTRVDVEAALAAGGMRVQRIVAYEAVASGQLSDTLIEQIKRGNINAATFLSQRAAAIFTRLLAEAKESAAIAGMDCFCLSAAIAEPLQSEPWRHIHVTQEPTLASLLECVDNVYPTDD